MKNTFCDISYLHNFANGDKERIKKYIGIFINTAPQYFDKINSCYTTSDWDGVRSTAHTLKPQVKFMGIKNLDTIINTLEDYSGRKTNLDKIPELMRELNDVSVKAIEELKQTLTEI